MTDWCSNYMMIECEDPAEIDAVLATILNDDRQVDFEKIIPTPSILLKVTTEQNVREDTLTVWIEENGHIRCLNPEEQAEYAACGSSNLRDWGILHWGTKWNASDTDVDDTGMSFGMVEIRYETPWNAPYPYLAKLRDLYPNVEFEFRSRTSEDHEYPNDITSELEVRINAIAARYGVKTPSVGKE